MVVYSQIRSYVNGTLYSLLSSPALREEAKKMVMTKMLNYMYSVTYLIFTQGMEEMLQSALRSSPAELQDQIQYIIVQFQSTGTPIGLVQ